MRILLSSFMCCALLLACAPDKASAPEIGFTQINKDKLAHGERVAKVLGCVGCHGDDLTGNDWSAPDFGTLWTANLSRLLPTMTDAQLEQALAGGVAPDGRVLWSMPSHLFTQLSNDDKAALIAYLRAQPAKGEVHPAPKFMPEIEKEIADGIWKSAKQDVAEQGKVWPFDAGAEHKQARYIVRATCAECHGMNLRGGQLFPEDPVKPDLRIAAAYDLKDFTKLLRTGVPAGERKLGLMADVAQGRYVHLTDAEIAAIHAYLKQVAEKDP